MDAGCDSGLSSSTKTYFGCWFRGFPVVELLLRSAVSQKLTTAFARHKFNRRSWNGVVDLQHKVSAAQLLTCYLNELGPNHDI